MRLRWFSEAILDIIEVRKYIAEYNPHAAQDVAERISIATTYLKDHPAIGRSGRVEGTRELVIPGLPYIIPYRVKANVIEILRVLHAAREWPKEF